MKSINAKTAGDLMKVGSLTLRALRSMNSPYA